jgi:hypothetical protein
MSSPDFSESDTEYGSEHSQDNIPNFLGHQPLGSVVDSCEPGTSSPRAAETQNIIEYVHNAIQLFLQLDDCHIGEVMVPFVSLNHAHHACALGSCGSRTNPYGRKLHCFVLG